jgi:hypothetical protein
MSFLSKLTKITADSWAAKYVIVDTKSGAYVKKFDFSQEVRLQMVRDKYKAYTLKDSDKMQDVLKRIKKAMPSWATENLIVSEQ